ncbi:MAG: fumarylacetoacetate hydrolase family protein [Actinomycetota bacterium]|nr:fumarylacetoacetate hydrolase family protein [Actinomycetota bacterium]
MVIGLGEVAVLTPWPSKVIGVEVAYASRATETGRSPEHPSYVLRPPSSLAERGGELLCPEGARQVAFAGAIALVIGEPARSVRPEDGMGHVVAVTAANLCSVPDLAEADGAGELRATGGDGYTPIGPRLLDAGRLELTTLVLRTWHNGVLVQEAVTAEELLFSFGLLVADVSRTITLERGDVLLTGTPAGAGAAEPGDVVEVEVTAGFATTGRLTTRVVAAPSGTLAHYGALPHPGGRVAGEHRPARRAADPASPVRPAPATVGKDGSAAPAAAAPAVLPPAPPAAAPAPAPAPPAAAAAAAAGDRGGERGGGGPIDPELARALGEVATATLAQQLRRRGLNGVVMSGLTATQGSGRMVGRARTVRYLPGREDVFAARGGVGNAQRKAVESLGPGEVLVIEARGDEGAGTIGDLLVLRAERLGAAGIVTDGPVRDAAAIRARSVPVFHRGTSPGQLGRRHVPYEADVAVACAGVLVEPGDLLVGDGDGVVVVPERLAVEVARDAAEQERQERFVADQLEGGASIVGLYPLGPEQRAAYRAWLEANGEAPAPR